MVIWFTNQSNKNDAMTAAPNITVLNIAQWSIDEPREWTTALCSARLVKEVEAELTAIKIPKRQSDALV